MAYVGLSCFIDLERQDVSAADLMEALGCDRDCADEFMSGRLEMTSDELNAIASWKGFELEGLIVIEFD